MLNVMRTHAKSWMIKLMLGTIIVVFVFFYGWTKFVGKDANYDNFSTAINVNGSEIPMGIFRLFYQENYQSFGKFLKDPESRKNFLPFVERTTVSTLVNRQMRLDLAQSLGVKISDLELRDAIKSEVPTSDSRAVKAYEDNLSYFKMRFGVNMEDLRRQDMMINELQNIFSVPEIQEMENGNQEEMTFLEIEIDPRDLKDKGVIGDEAQAKEMAFLFLKSKDEGTWNSLAKKNKLVVNRRDKVSIANRTSLLSGRGELSEHLKIFSLNSNKPVLDEPLELAGKYFVVMFKNKKSVDKKTKDSDKSVKLLDAWLSQASKDVKIKTRFSDA